MKDDLVSVIICSIDLVKYETICQNFAELLKEERFEIIGIHDAKSLSEGYNRGVRQSSGSIIIFSHDDIEIVTPDFSRKIKDHLNHFDIVGVAGTSKLVNCAWSSRGHPYIHGVITHFNRTSDEYEVTVFGADRSVVPGIQALDGVFLAVRRKTLETVTFDEQTFDGFHLYDVDFTYSAFLAGFQLAVCNDIALIHWSSGNFDDVWRGYCRRFLAKFQGRLQEDEPGNAQQGWIACRNRAEILEMMSPRILAQVTDDIRKKASMHNNSRKKANPAQTALLTRLSRWLLGRGNF